jgi:hypothetical protein
VLAEPLEESQKRLVDLDTKHLAAVQRRRELPTRLIQRFQALIQQRVLAPTLRSNEPFAPPLFLRLLLRAPIVRNIPSRIIAFGLWRVRAKEQRKHR